MNSRALNLRYRPQPIVTAEIERASHAAARLFARPIDWLRRVHRARFDIAIHTLSNSAARDGAVLHALGFKPLCLAWMRHPGLFGRVEHAVEVWIDPTAKICAEIVGDRTFLSTVFHDGAALVSLADATVAQWLHSPTCEVVVGTGDLEHDIAEFYIRAQLREVDGSAPLLCATAAAYIDRTHILTLYASKAPHGTTRLGDHGLIYPMTLMLAAATLASRDARGVVAIEV